MKYTRLSILTLLLGLVFGLTAGAQTSSPDYTTADALLQRCTREFSNGAVQLDFRVSGNGGKFDGKITMSGKAFAMVIPDIRVWFDGKTQWTLANDATSGTRSVNITEPTPEEIMELNPFVILANYSSRYDARRLKGAPAGSQRVLLSPQGKSPAGLVSATLTLSDKTGLPQAVDLVFDNGAEIKATVREARKLPKLSPGAFRFNAADYPGTEIIDLR
ncbi:MAG: hypothetical protein K2M06_06965 [Muribaculaceae bacterium]|nr:hypothetical protein [Muribaculaceae bacterium]